MSAFRERCIALRKNDYSINEIMKATGRPRSSVYAHIRGIPLSDQRMRQYRVASGRQIRKFALARKGKSARPFRSFTAWSTATVLLIAHLLFDGEISKGRCVYNNRSRVLIERVEELVRGLYDFSSKRYRNELTGVWKTSYYNVALSAYLKTKSKELLRGIKKMPPSLKREFLRAFFDDEGCMDFRPGNNVRKIRGYQKEVRTLEIIKALLADFDIAARIVPPNEVIIVGKENLARFEREINFSLGVYMNGRRSNSRWGKHVEKRELLKRAIRSFKT